MRSIMISVAPVDATDTHNDPIAIAQDVIQCAQKGASMVHLHCRDANGALTPDTAHLKNTADLIRAQSDIVMEISTGGVSTLSIQERCTPCQEPFTECCSLNVGSVNLGKSVYINPIDEVKYCVSEILQNSKIPEVEVFEPGMIYTTKKLVDSFDFPMPILFAIVLGHEGAMPATPKALDLMLCALNDCFGDSNDVLWGITQAHRSDWSLVRYALEKGASSVRIGFEDSHLLASGEIASHNHLQVEELVAVLSGMGMRPSTAIEARQMLGIQSR